MQNAIPANSASGANVNRWAIAIAAFFVQLALGAVYAWSVFLTPVMDYYHVKKPEANLTFTIALLAVGFTAGFGGYFQSRFGPRAIATTGGILYGLGVIISGLLPSSQIFLLYITYGIISGIGIGLAYIVPLAMLIKWFPDRRGFITGLAVAGFGLGAAGIAPLASSLTKPDSLGLNTTFIVLGIIYLIIVVGGAQFFRKAPDGYAPPGWTPTVQETANRSTRDYTLAEALRDPRWWVLWLTMTLNVTAGAALISVASPLAQNLTGVSSTTAALLVTTNSVFNGVGRLFWGWTSDRLGRPYTFVTMFVIQIICVLIIAQISSFGLLIVLAGLILLCYGGGFGTMPAFAADFFGAKYSGMIYGAMLTAWGIGAAIGPVIISGIDYKTALYIIAAIAFVGLFLPLVARYLNNRSATNPNAPNPGSGRGPVGA